MKTTVARCGIFPGAMCDHLFDTTSRYDHERKLLTFSLFCPVCRDERVVKTLAYEPQYTPLGGAAYGGLRK